MVLEKSAEGMMASRSYICRLLLAGVLVTLGGFGELEPLVLAASAKSKKEAKLPVAKPPSPDRQDSTALPKAGTKQSARTESSKPVAVVAQGQTPSDRAPRKIRRHSFLLMKRRPP